MYAAESGERPADVRRLLGALRRANGVILATPCYHGSVSGLLKNALDYVEDMAQGRAVGLIVSNKTFDEYGSVVEETAARQIGILVSQVAEFARMRCGSDAPVPQ